jgi:glycosyltransferase involved in cell wall biosynthesis
MSSPTLLVWGGATGIGGTESRMAEVVGHWRSQGRRTISVILRAEGDSPLRRLLEASGSEVVQVPALRRLGSIIRRSGTDLVIAFGLEASLVVRALRLAARLRRRPWPYTVDARNGLEMTRRTLPALVDRLTQVLVDTFLANSDAVAASLVRRGFSAGRVRVLYSALGDSWQSHTAGQDPEPASIVMVGNARPEKQQWLGLEVFARLPQAATLSVFTNDAAALRRCWDGLPASAPGEVLIYEGRSVTPRDLAPAAIMLHPSRSESAPRCLMEGRACGCYVVAFDVGDTRRIVSDGGTVVAPGDQDALLAALTMAVRASVAGTLPRSRSRYPSVAEYAVALGAIGADA